LETLFLERETGLVKREVSLASKEVVFLERETGLAKKGSNTKDH
jgi:hypothetical protein